MGTERLKITCMTGGGCSARAMGRKIVFAAAMLAAFASTGHASPRDDNDPQGNDRRGASGHSDVHQYDGHYDNGRDNRHNDGSGDNLYTRTDGPHDSRYDSRENHDGRQNNRDHPNGAREESHGHRHWRYQDGRRQQRHQMHPHR